MDEVLVERVGGLVGGLVGGRVGGWVAQWGEGQLVVGCDNGTSSIYLVAMVVVVVGWGGGGGVASGGTWTLYICVHMRGYGSGFRNGSEIRRGTRNNDKLE